MKKSLNILLLISFVLTVMVPVTGIHIHKLAATMFLLLSIIHIVTHRKKLNFKRWMLLVLILFSFISGLSGMILEEYPVILRVHDISSIGLVFFLAIHTFVFHKKMILHMQSDQTRSSTHREIVNCVSVHCLRKEKQGCTSSGKNIRCFPKHLKNLLKS